MCTVSVKKKTRDVIKTSYQRAHYYENEQKIHLVRTPVEKLKSRPDLYFYDPIINEKKTIYQKAYTGKKPSKFKTCGRVDLTTKHTLKNLYDDFVNRPVRELKYSGTVTGSDFKNPSSKLEAKFCTDFSINCFSNDENEKCCPSFINPYVSTSQYYHRDFCEERKYGIAKDDAITRWNNRATNRYPEAGMRKFCDNTPRTFFKVPFNGDVSIHQSSYKCPKLQCEYPSEIRVIPEYPKKCQVSIEEKPSDSDFFGLE